MVPIWSTTQQTKQMNDLSPIFTINGVGGQNSYNKHCYCKECEELTETSVVCNHPETLQVDAVRAPYPRSADHALISP